MKHICCIFLHWSKYTTNISVNADRRMNRPFTDTQIVPTKKFEKMSQKCSKIQVILPFQHLREIEFYGGAFYSDKISQVIDVRGKQLTKINLISIKEVDFLAIALLSVKCPNVSNCNTNHFLWYLPFSGITPCVGTV